MREELRKLGDMELALKRATAIPRAPKILVWAISTVEAFGRGYVFGGCGDNIYFMINLNYYWYRYGGRVQYRKCFSCFTLSLGKNTKRLLSRFGRFYERLQRSKNTCQDEIRKLLVFRHFARWAFLWVKIPTLEALCLNGVGWNICIFLFEVKMVLCG